jgi:hypothetical protein
MYLKNMDFFLENGVTCWSDSVDVDYIIVLTRDVADHYTSPDGLITKKKQYCIDLKTNELRSYESSIEVVVRQDRCYDMESIRVVAEQKDLQSEYDDMVFLNCGMVGPKIGHLSPIPPNVHWTQLFTSLLTDSIRMSGLSINPNPRIHIQSFLYSMSTKTLHLLLEKGNIFDCGGRLGNVVNVYEVGMARTILSQNYSLAVPFMNNFELGKTLVVNRTNTAALEGVPTRKSDIWNYKGDNMRTATSTMDQDRLKKVVGAFFSEESLEEYKFSILPWEFYIFFKVSRFVPFDIQIEMMYDLELLMRDSIPVIPNK